MGYWYNGYYSGLLIRQIRVQIPGDPLTPHHTMWCKKVASCDRNAEVRFESGNLSVMNQKEK